MIAVYDTVAEAYMMQQVMQNAAAGTSTKYTVGATKTSMGDDYLAKTVYGVTLGEGYDTYGRPSTTYTASTKAKATTYGWNTTTLQKVMANDAILTYTTAFTGKAATLALQNAGYKIDSTVTVSVFTNGKQATASAADVTAFTTSTASVGGNGCLVEFYANSNKVVNEVVIVNTYLGVVSNLVKDTAATTTVDERSMRVTIPSSNRYYTATVATPGFDEVYTAAAAAIAAGKDAYALVVPDNDNTATAGTAVMVALPTVKTVTPTTIVGNSSFTTSDATYKYSKNNVGTVGSFSEQTIMLDKYGYVIGAQSVATTANLAVLAAVDSATSWGTTTYKARLVMADGTTSDVAISNNDAATLATMTNTVVNYSVTSNVYTLSKMGTASTPVANYTGASKTAAALAVTKGVSAISFDGAYTANAHTVFVLRSGAGTTASPYTYTAYTGIANVPCMTNAVLEQTNASTTGWFCRH
jgi:hypothetical protein